MADTINLPGAGAVVATDDIAGVHYQRIKLVHGADGVNAGDVASGNPLPVSGPVTDAQLRATAVSVSLTSVTDGTQKAQLQDSQSNSTALVSSLRHLIAGQVNRVYGDSFANGIGTGEDSGTFPATATVVGTGTGLSAAGHLTLRTGATAGGSATLQSTSILNFVTGSVSQNQNGNHFPSANLTAFRAVSRKAAVDTVVESSAFNVVPTPITDPGLAGALAGALIDNKLHRNDIFYQGNSAIFAIDGNAVHRMPGSLASPRTESLDLPTRFEVFSAAGPVATIRSGQYDANNGYFFECTYNVLDVILNVRGSSASRIGPAQPYLRTGAKGATQSGLISSLNVNADIQAVHAVSPPSTLIVTATAAANTALTLTLPAAGAGLFHHITHIQIHRTATAALAGTATLVITSTNLPGSYATSVGNAMTAGGTQKDLDIALGNAIKSSVANTATTIVMPAPGAAVLWRAAVFYYTAP